MEKSYRKKLVEFAAKRTLGKVRTEDYPIIALSLLEEGCESDVVTEIAGLVLPDSWDVLQLWEKLEKEFGLPIFTEIEATTFLVLAPSQALARRYLNGELSLDEFVSEIESLNREYKHPDLIAGFCWINDSITILDESLKQRLIESAKSQAQELLRVSLDPRFVI